MPYCKNCGHHYDGLRYILRDQFCTKDCADDYDAYIEATYKPKAEEIEQRFREAEPEQYESYPPRESVWRYVPLAVILIVLLLLTGAAQAETFTQERRLLDYIEEHTGMETSHIMPRYEFWSPEKLNQVYYAEHYSGQRNVLALTINGTIMLPYFFDEEAQPEVLLHELFHLAVFENDVKYNCIGEEEMFAYALQDQFVAEQGWGMKSDPFMVFLMQCHHLIPR